MTTRSGQGATHNQRQTGGTASTSRLAVRSMAGTRGCGRTARWVPGGVKVHITR